MAPSEFIKISLVSLVLFGTYSCSCNRAEKQSSQVQTLQDTSVDKKVVQDDYFSMPSPEEILTYFNSKPLKYHPGITCSTKNIEHYLEYESQLQMIGVYSSDLAYLTLHQRQDEIMNYFSAIQNLAEKTKISSAFNKNTIKRVLNNQNYPDSLAEIARSSYIKVLSYLLSYDLQNPLAVVLYGAFIESLYLSLDYIESYSVNNELIQKIADQKYAFDNLYMFSKQYLTVAYNPELLNNLEKLQTLFSSIGHKNSQSEVKSQSKDGKLVIGGKDEVEINEAQFNQLKALITELRTKMIQ